MFWIKYGLMRFANHLQTIILFFYLYFTQCYTELDMYKHACKCAHMQRQPDKNRIEFLQFLPNHTSPTWTPVGGGRLIICIVYVK